MSRARPGRRAIAACLLAVVAAAAGAASAHAVTTGQAMHRAADWLAKDSIRNKMSDYSGIQADAVDALVAARRHQRRSEEHTSELQSQR